MTNEIKIRDHMRSVYFDLMTNSKDHDYKSMISRMIEELCKLLEASYVGIYTYNDSVKKYQWLAAESVDVNMLNDEYLSEDDLFSDPFMEEKTFTIRMTSEQDYHTEEFLLLMIGERDLMDEDLLVIKTETEKMLNHVYFISTKIEKNNKNEYLYWLSSHLHASTDKHIVLGRIVESLENTFQEYEHCLLLSHEFNANKALPIRSIDSGEAHEKRSSSTAFITGEVQIDSANNQTYLYAPLLGNQGVYGVIQMISPTITSFKEIEMAFIAQIAQTAGRALETVTLHEASVHLISDLKLINHVTHQLNSKLEFDELIRILKTELLTISKATEIGFVYYHDNQSTNYEILMESTSYFRSAEGRQLIKKLNKEVDPILSGDFTKEYTEFSYRSMIFMPMVRADFNYGFVVVSHEEESYFTFETFKLIKSLVSHSTLALTNAVLKDQLEKAVITDYLTQLYSRNYLDKILNNHLKKDDHGTFLLFDIDDFKSINDTYGHYVGDQVIKQIADVVRKNISRNDFPARWGGEEFAVYLPHHSLEKGIEIAEKIRKDVLLRTSPSVTVSCGISMWDKQRIDSASAIFIRADKALYRAKETGKNTIITESELWDFVKK